MGLSLFKKAFLILALIAGEQMHADSIQIFKLVNPAIIGVTAAKDTIHLGGFSALQYIKKENNLLHFKTITDRGPNGEEIKTADGMTLRPFLLPDFKPLIVDITVDLKSKNFNADKFFNYGVSGLPHKEHKNKKAEVAVDIKRTVIPPSTTGVDSEGFCFFNNKSYISDEYGPDLLEINQNNEITNRWSPNNGLPKELEKRKLNAGFEGLSCSDQYIYAMLQKPLEVKDKGNKKFIPLYKFDPKNLSGITTYLYPTEKKNPKKIGDIAWIKNETLLVLEQNGELGSEKGHRQIYKVNLNRTASGLNVLEKTLLLDLNKLGFDFVEKIEGLTVIDNKTLAIITDNDFGLTGDINFETGKATFNKDSFSYLAIITLDKNIED